MVTPPKNAVSSAGQLAAILRAASDDDLVRDLSLRSMTTSHSSLNGIRDFFDLAEVILSSASLQQCLAALDRRSLTALVHLSKNGTTAGATWANEPAEHESRKRGKGTSDDAVLKHLQRLFLVCGTADGVTVWPEVTAQLARWQARGLANTWAEAPEPGTSVTDTTSHATDSLAAERAFTSTTAIAELLFDLGREPLRMLATGLLSRSGERRFAELLNVNDVQVASYINIAENAGLAERSANNLVASDAHREWLNISPAERWAIIAETWVTAHCSEIRERISQRHFEHDSGIRDWLFWNYPGAVDWPAENYTTRMDEAGILGLIANGTVSSLGAKILNGDIEAATDQLAAALPAPVDRLYLQHDLTAVATGPLDTRIDTRLRTMADVDGHTIASRYRFSCASVTRALSHHETVGSILEFLNSITLSGIPQPLDYLINETASRHGLLRVGPLQSGDAPAIAYVRSDDKVLLRTVLIDRNLSALRMRPRDSTYLVSPCERDQLYAALCDAKYPVALEDANGRIIETRPKAMSNIVTRNPEEPTRPDPHRALVDRIRIADADAPNDSGEAWHARQLDSAIRSKSTVTISVRMPNGNVVDYQLAPTSVAGGRLRARDPISEIERTLPLSSIAGVRGA